MALQLRFAPHGAAAFGLVATAGACKGPPELAVRDSEGRTFSVVCAEAEGPCKVTQRSGPTGSGSGAAILRAKGRFMGVCDGDAPDRVADCRPLTCASDADCPPATGAKTGTCVGSLCTEPAHALDTEDAILLCMAGTGLGHERPEQVSRYALALNCGTPCTIPKPCRQP